MHVTLVAILSAVMTVRDRMIVVIPNDCTSKFIYRILAGTLRKCFRIIKRPRCLLCLSEKASVVPEVYTCQILHNYHGCG